MGRVRCQLPVPHNFRCPGCGEAITPVDEHYYESIDTAIPEPLEVFDHRIDGPQDGDQLHECENDDCQVMRLFPTSSGS